MADKGEPRVYGMADQANRDLPAAEGMRGEKPSVRPREREPDLSHKVTLGDGNTVTVSEGSGVAWAEATGRAGLAEPKPWLEPAPEEGEPPTRFNPAPLIAGLAIGAGVLAFVLWRLGAVERDVLFRPAPELDL
jgi:hypothetical protein